MFSVSPETYQIIHQVSRFLFAFGGVLLLVAALAWLLGENRAHKEARRSNPAAGTVGELVVISGNDELPGQTWFPVIRDGVLGSVRSCDLVVPCSGVRPHHLDFSWQDGTGLLIRPRSGCEVRVNDVLLDCKSDPASAPLTHGSSLQVGSAVLRLHLFAALDHTSASRVNPEPDSYSVPPVPEGYPSVPVQNPNGYAPVPVQDPNEFGPVPMQNPGSFGPVPGPVFMPPAQNPFPPQPFPGQPPVSPAPVVPAPSQIIPDSSPVVPDPAVSSSRPRRSDRWKEDWSE